MSVPVRSATELAATIKYCSALLADWAEEDIPHPDVDGVRADILAAAAALVALAELVDEMQSSEYFQQFAERIKNAETELVRYREVLERGANEGESESLRAWCKLALAEARP